MIVGIVKDGSGLVRAEEFRSGNDVAAALAAFCSQHSPPLDPADYFAFDTGWSARDARLQGSWAWDYSSSAMVETEGWRPDLVADVIAHRDVRLSGDALAEFPPASGIFFGCSIADQNEVCKLAVLDQMGMVPYPIKVYSHDRAAVHDLASSDLSGFVGAISAVVLAERTLAQTYIAAVLAAPTAAKAQAAAAPYLAL